MVGLQDGVGREGGLESRDGLGERFDDGLKAVDLGILAVKEGGWWFFCCYSREEEEGEEKGVAFGHHGWRVMEVSC